METIFLGIDVSKSTLDICLDENSIKHSFQIGNTVKQIRIFFSKYSKYGNNLIIGMENTGLYNFNLYEVLADFKFKVFVVDPRHIKRSIGLVRGKNDELDAKRISNFIEKNHSDLNQWRPMGQTIRAIKLLLSQRRQKVKQQNAIKQQNKELKVLKRDPTITNLIKINLQHISQMERHIAKIERLIKEELPKDEDLKNNIDLLQTIPGIGPITAWTLAVKTDGFTRLTDPRKLACFAGVVPFEQQSGTSIRTKPRVSKMADGQLKSTLQMAAMRAVRMENDLKHFYLRKVAQGKNKMSVLNAVRNKLIHIAMAIIKTQKKYENRLVLS